jgi:hypothetical protein
MQFLQVKSNEDSYLHLLIHEPKTGRFACHESHPVFMGVKNNETEHSPLVYFL